MSLLAGSKESTGEKMVIKMLNLGLFLTFYNHFLKSFFRLYVEILAKHLDAICRQKFLFWPVLQPFSPKGTLRGYINYKLLTN